MTTEAGDPRLIRGGGAANLAMRTAEDVSGG